MKNKSEENLIEESKFNKKLKAIKSVSLQTKLLNLNEINDILLYDKEDKFHADYKKIRGNYEKNSFKIYNEISDIIKGKINPEISEEDYKKYGIKKDNEKNEILNYKSVDDFWLKAIKNSDYFDLSETEEKILSYLKDVQINLHENLVDLTIKYIFEKNPYFSNEILTKKYLYDMANEKLEKSEFDEINWQKKDKDNKDRKKKKFFDMFDKEKISNELDENEANFLKNDFFPGLLEYYLDFVSNSDKSDDFSEGKNKINVGKGKNNIKQIKHK